MAELLASLRDAGAQEQATALADRAATHVSLDNPVAVARLLASLRDAGAQQQATALADRAATHVCLDNPVAVAELLASLRDADAQQQVTALADRLPAAGMFSLFERVQRNAVPVRPRTRWSAGRALGLGRPGLTMLRHSPHKAVRFMR